MCEHTSNLIVCARENSHNIISKLIVNIDLRRLLPQHVQDLSTRIDSDQNIWNCDILELSIFGIGKIDFRFPDCLDQIWIIQIQGIHQLRVM